MNNTLEEVAAITAAFGNGKTIRKRNAGVGGFSHWEDDPNPTWAWESYEYQIKPREPVQIYGTVPEESQGAINDFKPYTDMTTACIQCTKGRRVVLMQEVIMERAVVSPTGKAGSTLVIEPPSETVKTPLELDSSPDSQAKKDKFKTIRSNTAWTPDEDSFLQRNYKTMNNRQLAEHLQRTVKSVSCRKTKLKIKDGKL